MGNTKQCTKASPMPKGASGRWQHADAVEVGEQEDGWPGGDIVRMECPHCGLSFKSELPQ